MFRPYKRTGYQHLGAGLHYPPYLGKDLIQVEYMLEDLRTEHPFEMIVPERDLPTIIINVDFFVPVRMTRDLDIDAGIGPAMTEQGKIGLRPAAEIHYITLQFRGEFFNGPV
jgi:hypothetical protein